MLKFLLLSIVFGAFNTSVFARESVKDGWYDSRFPVPVMHLEGSIEDVANRSGVDG